MNCPLKKKATLGNLLEAQVSVSGMEERNVPHRIRFFDDTAYDGLFEFLKGWGEIYAPIANKEEILAIIKSTDR